MKILLGSHFFFPSTGGIETTSELLAREFSRAGHEVRVITQTAEGGGAFPFLVVRQPGALELWQQIKWCDLFLQNNISLRTLWPLLFRHRPLFITHQTWIAGTSGRAHWSHSLKRLVLHFAKSLAISEAIAKDLPTASVPVGNPYDDEIFTNLGGIRRTDLIFVGRLVSDKGADVLLSALAVLRETTGLTPGLTIAGDGPERASLEAQVARLELQGQVKFVGNQHSRALATLLNDHKILVVPSRWQEPFGIVALEGIACGCVVVGSAGGGLQEAIGPCGLTFPNGDEQALADILKRLLTDPSASEKLRRETGAHLAKFTRKHVAKMYLQAFVGSVG